MAKIFDKLVNCKVSSFLEDNLLDPSQFRVNTCTENTLIAVLDNIRLKVDQGSMAHFFTIDPSPSSWANLDLFPIPPNMVYVEPLANLVKKWIFDICSYANDDQLIMFLGDGPSNTKQDLAGCLSVVAGWMSVHYLKLNAEKC